MSALYETQSHRIPYTLVVDDLNDGCQLSIVLAALEEDDAADLDVPPLAR